MPFGKVCLLSVAVVLLVGAAAASAQTTPKGFAGTAQCGTCHDEISKAFDKNPHHVVDTDKHLGHAGFACETCHGPGAKHADSLSAADIRNPAKLSPDEQNKLCLTCHRNESTPVGRIAGGHPEGGPGCVGCHSIHGTDHRPLVVHGTADVNKMCAACHQSVWADFQRPYKHRLPEGAMSCVGCHNPHGSGSETQRVAFANEPGCFRCHGEMRGPFTYEHAPVRLEGCMACHEPHGSANPRMLIRHEVRFVCLECHSNVVTNPPPAGHQTLGGTPPSFHDLRNPRYQNCTVCHVKIHGSYVDGTLLR
jgi:DmsE family decaheme c-type cytochrome